MMWLTGDLFKSLGKLRDALAKKLMSAEMKLTGNKRLSEELSLFSFKKCFHLSSLPPHPFSTEGEGTGECFNMELFHLLPPLRHKMFIAFSSIVEFLLESVLFINLFRSLLCLLTTLYDMTLPKGRWCRLSELLKWNTLYLYLMCVLCKHQQRARLTKDFLVNDVSVCGEKLLIIMKDFECICHILLVNIKTFSVHK